MNRTARRLRIVVADAGRAVARNYDRCHDHAAVGVARLEQERSRMNDTAPVDEHQERQPILHSPCDEPDRRVLMQASTDDPQAPASPPESHLRGECRPSDRRR